MTDTTKQGYRKPGIENDNTTTTFVFQSNGVQVDKAVEITEKALEEDKCVVIGLQSTGERLFSFFFFLFFLFYFLLCFLGLFSFLRNTSSSITSYVGFTFNSTKGLDTTGGRCVP